MACSTALGASAFAASLSTAAHAAPVASAPESSGGQPAASWFKAYTQGQWSAAIELLDAIPESSRTAWHWLHLARALERSSRLVESFAAYERVHDLAADASLATGMRDVERQAKAESSALAGRIPWAEVSLNRSLPVGALVFVDQQWLDPARLRSPYPVNPGWHTFLIESNGEVLAARRTFFEEGQTRLVPLAALDVSSDVVGVASRTAAVAMPATSAAPAAVDDRAGGARASSRRALTWRPDERRHPDTDHEAGSLLKASYVGFGVGVLGTLVGTGFLVSALNTRTRVDDYANCFSSRCESTSLADVEHQNRTWRARASAATASYAIGLAGLVTGGVLWLLHRDSSARAATINLADLSIELAPRFSPHGAIVRGTF